MFQKLIAVIGTILCGVVVNHAAENKVILKPGPEGVDKYFGSYYDKQGNDNGILRTGGWGDYVDTLIAFEGATQSVAGTFKRAELWLYRINTTRPTNMKTWLLTTRWSEAQWDHANLMGYYLGDYPGPTVGSGWYGLDVTPSVNYWRQNPTLNYGWLFAPAANDNRWDEFHSSDSTSTLFRPELHLVYDSPDFKLPLPAGNAWKLTVEAGGKANTGSDDTFHTGTTYYSLDFSPWSVQSSGIGPMYLQTDVPILAMAAGKVYGVGSDLNSLNGNNVRIDHDGDGNPATGSQTVYLHMKAVPLVKAGDMVVQGQKLGIIGMTGTGNTGIHIHVTFYCKGTAIGNGSDPQLDQLRIEGRLIKDYKLNLSNRATPIFYPSSNIQR